MAEIYGLIQTIEIRDILDILAVTVVFYVIFSMLRETRSSVVLRGLITILIGSLIIYFTARVVGLNAVLLLFERFWVVVVLLFIIVFQHDFRRSLTQVGQMRLVRRLFTEGGQHIEEVIRAVTVMSKRRVGAIVAFERRNPLRVYMETGTQIDARINAELLRTIFTAHSPLHDGAVILRNEQLVAAGCILPLSADTKLSKDLGTRHRAALGLSEETDAAVVVISEETGGISTALNGHLRRGVSPGGLREFLDEALDIKPKEDENG